MSKIYETTLPALLLRQATENPHKIAMREKEWGVWQSFTWKQYRDATAEFAAGLRELGLGQGDIIILIGDNRPEWLWAELAIQSIGGMALGLYQDSIAEEIEYIFTLSEAKLVVAEDQEQVDKILKLKSDLSNLTYIVYHDPKGLAGAEENIEGLMSFESVRKRGSAKAGEFAAWVAKITSTDPCLIVTTSGTTGRSKLAIMSHRNMLSMAANLGAVDPKYATDEFVSFLPLAWIGEQMMAVASSLLFGFCVNFPEDPGTVQGDIREIGPNLVFSPPRVWENLAATVRVKIMETTRCKRFLYNRLMPLGMGYIDKIFAGETPSIALKIGYFLADKFLFRALRDRLGFSKIRSAITGGAALGPDTFKFFHALGVKLKQIYGQTEIAGISCIHRDGAVDFTSVGEPIPETEVRITDEGEIISRSPAVFLGYYKNQEATDETISDGWLHSGDAGYFDDNNRLVVIDRLKDVMHLADGTKFSPQFLENKLKFSPYVKEAVVLGQAKSYTTCVICIDADIVGRWAESKMITYTTYQDLAAKKEVYALIRDEIVTINQGLSEETQLKRFALLFKELDADDGELTRTRKVRRRIISERYAPLIHALYSDVRTMNLEVEIKYQDGSARTMRGDIHIKEVG